VAKKNTDPVQAKVSKIPVELNDAPLVIDLPDGQKIILGKMQNGAVIEVATWHGTGRPDSRTNRFMIGMTNGDGTSPAPSEATTSEVSPVKKARSFDVSGPLRKVDGFLTSAKALINNLSLPLKNALNKTKDLAPVDTTTELEINAWLNSITSEAAKKVERSASASPKKVVKKAAPKKK
jgi:hypothetical protein